MNEVAVPAKPADGHWVGFGWFCVKCIFVMLTYYVFERVKWELAEVLNEG